MTHTQRFIDMRWFSERVQDRLVSLLLFVSAVWIAASFVNAWLPPLFVPHVCVRMPLTPWPRNLSVSKAFNLHKPHRFTPKPKPKPKPKKAAVSLKGYELLMTAVGKQPMALIKHKGKNKLLGLHEKIDGFELVDVAPRRITLQKGGRTYTLVMPESHKKLATLSYSVTNKKRKRVKKTSPRAFLDKIVVDKDENRIMIPRELIRIMHTPRKIFQYIDFQPKVRNGKIYGYAVTRVLPGSIFEKMGLKREDVITAVNNTPLTDEKTIFSFFNNVDDIDSLTLTLIRRGKTKEITYEIY